MQCLYRLAHVVHALQEGEELTITYGKIWFEDQSLKTRTDEDDPVHHHMDDPDGFLAALAL